MSSHLRQPPATGRQTSSCVSVEQRNSPIESHVGTQVSVMKVSFDASPALSSPAPASVFVSLTSAVEISEASTPCASGSSDPLPGAGGRMSPDLGEVHPHAPQSAIK